jgi:hypothetical protein
MCGRPARSGHLFDADRVKAKFHQRFVNYFRRCIWW